MLITSSDSFTVLKSMDSSAIIYGRIIRDLHKLARKARTELAYIPMGEAVEALNALNAIIHVEKKEHL